MKPRLLRADNLTPPTRTPWGGEEILGHYKSSLGLTHQGVVGESWEISVEPSFPSRFADDGSLLRDAIAADPDAWLGPEVALKYAGQTPLLVKLLDAADNLSVQVHPEDGDPNLEADESGKPEAWIVLDAKPGAGLYLGFRDGVGPQEVTACLDSGGALDALMNFVPVSSGDTFIIAAGTPHAIGAGVTLVEPQYVAPGKRGVTYRFWDWGRRYDAQGRRDPDGEPRPLHVERSLDVTSWKGLGASGFVERCRARPKCISSGPLERLLLVDWPWFISERWRGSGALEIESIGTMWALCVVEGHADLHFEGGVLRVSRGQSAVVPAALGAFRVEGQSLDMLSTYSPLSAPA